MQHSYQMLSARSSWHHCRSPPGIQSHRADVPNPRCHKKMLGGSAKRACHVWPNARLIALVLEIHVGNFIDLSQLHFKKKILYDPSKNILKCDLKLIFCWWIQCLVGGIPTPLKNMTSSIGMMKFPIDGKIIQSCSSHHQSDIDTDHSSIDYSYI